jgi:hypothetical protein
MHPDVNSSGGQADNGTAVTTKDLVAEAHIWTGGSFDDTTSFFGEVTFSTAGTVSIEHAAIFFNDLLFGPHILNVRLGKTSNTLTSFGMHSSYVADTYLPPLGVTAIFGSPGDTWTVSDKYTGIEANGVIGGRFNYALGFNAGTNFNVKNSQTVYAHLGFKLGGLRLDGEGGGGATETATPWAENAFTLDAFALRTASNFQPAAAPMGATVMFADNCATGASGPQSPCLDDVILAAGGSLRGQIQSFELNAGAYVESHNHATPDNLGALAVTQFDEVSYIVFPWFVPAARIELSQVTPKADSVTGAPGIFGTRAYYDLRFIPGVAALVRPNVKLTLTAQFEHAVGNFPTIPGTTTTIGSWASANGSANPVACPAPAQGSCVGGDATKPLKSFEAEAVALGLWFAF